MHYNQKRMLRLITFIVVLLGVIVMIGGNVLAIAPAKITVAPAWRPAVTLDSIDLVTPNAFDVGDDFRYVDAEIYITTTVQFWAVQLTCSVTPQALTSYDSAASDGDPGNTVEPVVWGPRWGTLGGEFTQVSDPYKPVTGSRTFTATRLGNLNPMGSYGYTDTFLLATVRYRAKDLTVAATSVFNCTTAFLNRNGAPVLVATYVAPAPLKVITGYAITGSVKYQGRANHAGINVACDGPDANSTPDFSILTTITGAFSNTALRNQGFFDCSLYGNVTDPAAGYQPDKYLAGRTFFNLSGQSYNILPITLTGGNLSRNDASTDLNATTTDEVIDGLDIGVITSPAYWSKPVTAGDVNGDGKTDRADLAITAANYLRYEQEDSRHVLYSVPRNYDYFQNSRIWIGPPTAGAVTQLVANPPAGAHDHWPTLSPDGKQLVFVRNPVSTTDVPALYSATITNGVAGAPVRLTPPGVWYSSWAPSWSPDGTRIAFLCSWYDDGSDHGDGNDYASGYLADMGSLCVIDANGRNAQTLPFAQKVTGRIYPPAWLSNTELVFGGSWTIPVTDEANQVCPNTLCYYNIQTTEARIFDPDIVVVGSQVADMPVIRNGVLFYRFYDNNTDTRVIRWAELVGGGVDPLEGRPGTAPFHMQLEYDNDFTAGTNYVPISTDVDYFNISQNSWDLIFYETGGYTISKSWWTLGSLAGPTPLEWWSPSDNWVDDMVGNPPPLITPDDPSDADDWSLLYGLRNTFDWVP